MKQYGWIVTLCAFLGWGACAPSDPAQQLQLQYRFADQRHYRVEAKYRFTDTMVKTHDNKPFLDKADVIHVSAAFHLRVHPLENDKWEAQYALLNISVQDEAGNYRIELSPQNGEITWFGKSEGFDDYFTKDELEQYRQLLQQPLAVVTTDAWGVQQTTNEKGQDQLNFNYALIRLVGKNRAIGRIVVKSMKIPPVLMAIFPHETVWKGKKWTYQGVGGQLAAVWDRPLTTVFELQAVHDNGAAIVFENVMEFTGPELTELGKEMGLSELANVTFEESRFIVKGNVIFDTVLGRPNEGGMTIQKNYGMKNGDEQWKLSEEQAYTFSVSPLTE